MDEELERFKTEIDLVTYAGSLGFEINAKKTPRNRTQYVVMKRGAEVIVITREATDGHYVYASPTDGHAGTIIDLAKRHVSQNFGEIRKALRRELGTDRPPPAFLLQKTDKDQQRVLLEWHQAADYVANDWLEDVRRIPRSLACSPRFEGCLKVDGRGNVLFAHRNIEEQLCGFEKKNRSFTGFSGGGEKGLGCSNDFDGDVRIVLAESFIDMLSYAALFPDSRARYRSFGGGLNPKQPELIRAHILALPRGSEVVAATDADDAGHGFAETIRSLSDGYAFREHCPGEGDWNDVLKGPSLPTARQVNEP